MALKPANQPIRWKERIGILGIGYSMKQVEKFVFDELIYGLVVSVLMAKMGAMGSLISFLIMASLSALMCSWYVKLYDRLKVDWFGFEAVKELRDGSEPEGWRMWLTRRIMKWGDIPAFFAILILHPSGDPFMAVIYLRKGAGEYNGMSRRDWDIFWAAVIVSNGYWTLRWSTIVVLVGKVFWPTSIKPMLQWFGLV